MGLNTKIAVHPDWETSLSFGDGRLPSETAHSTSGAVSPGGYNGQVLDCIDLGSGLVTGIVVIDVTAIETGSNNEKYVVVVQGSNDPAFGAGTVENLTAIDFGAGAVRAGGAQTSVVGRYFLGFSNQARDVNYRYIRAYDVISGTIATGISYQAWLSKSDC